jgi:hypothetical protein
MNRPRRATENPEEPPQGNCADLRSLLLCGPELGGCQEGEGDAGESTDRERTIVSLGWVSRIIASGLTAGEGSGRAFLGPQVETKSGQHEFHDSKD